MPDGNRSERYGEEIFDFITSSSDDDGNQNMLNIEEKLNKI